ncbi:HNH endonuclease [Halorussus lipolyticus]|uniref:HNH endonuclease n=1 Tax=Halorussus lipolyticus TaxID=3034024 RepID=UPI0023E869AC|nr:HNH endonuclease [Halorussus sp. DT80]
MSVTPIDVLEDLAGEQVSVVRKEAEPISGSLDSFDGHLNLEVGGSVVRGNEIVLITTSNRPKSQSTIANHKSDIKHIGEVSEESQGIDSHRKDSKQEKTSETVEDEAIEESIRDSDDKSDIEPRNKECDGDKSSSNSELIGSKNRELVELRKKAESAASDDPVRDTSELVGSRYVRAPAIKQYAKTRADGICEYCDDSAPFLTDDGDPYLEVHHVDELGEGGVDHPDTVVALCPTCHKQIHHGKEGEKMNQELKEMLEDGLADIGVED